MEITHLVASIISPILAAVLTGLGVIWAQAKQAARREGATSATNEASMAQMRTKIDELNTTIDTERRERQNAEQRIFDKLDEIAREARTLAGQHGCIQVATLTELKIRQEHQAADNQAIRRRLHDLADRITETIVLLNERTGGPKIITPNNSHSDHLDA